MTFIALSKVNIYPTMHQRCRLQLYNIIYTVSHCAWSKILGVQRLLDLQSTSLTALGGHIISGDDNGRPC